MKWFFKISICVLICMAFTIIDVALIKFYNIHWSFTLGWLGGMVYFKYGR